MTAKFCTSCGTPLAPATQFCTQCGAAVPDATAEQVPVTSSSSTVDQREGKTAELGNTQLSRQGSTAADQADSGKKKLMGWAAAAGMLLLVGWGLVDYLGKRPSREANPVSAPAVAESPDTNKSPTPATTQVQAEKRRELPPCPNSGEKHDCIGSHLVNGDRYEGEWRNGKPHGLGTYYWADGRRHTGEWSNDKRHGRGTFYHANGNRYEGGWRDDKLHGPGTAFIDGRRENEWYVDGKQILAADWEKGGFNHEVQRG